MVQENEFENVVCEMLARLFQLRWVNIVFMQGNKVYKVWKAPQIVLIKS